MKPLEDLLVIDLSQYLAGPAASMRLADLGARVIKVERPGIGDGSRRLTLNNLTIEGDSTVFHCMNRNKESYEADLKNRDDFARVKHLIARADVLMHNFRPGIMERLGLDYETLSASHSQLIYAGISGYGERGPWATRPGQDLLVQSLSGLPWLNGYRNGKPVPFGLSVVDMFASAHVVQGILALLARRNETGYGGRVDTSLFESALDLQFEVLTTYFNDGGRLPDRGSSRNAHAYLGAPYGIYQTMDGYVALAMGSVVSLGTLIGATELAKYTNPQTWFTNRDEIKEIIAKHLRFGKTEEWVSILESGGYWCAPVLNIEQFSSHPGFTALDLTQSIRRPGGRELWTTRCPIRVDGGILKSNKWAPRLGEDTERLNQEFRLDVEVDKAKGAPRELGDLNPKETMLPLKDLLVLDFSQFLSGPSATLRLADLGARVIKIERPEVGDICRTLYVSNVVMDGESSLFHAINRNKESVAVNLKDDANRAFLESLIRQADIVVENFRPGVMERLGLDYERVKKINPRIIFGSITGYGTEGPWRDKPGQDLLVQALSGLTWLNGDKEDPPVAFGLSVADMMAGAHLVQGILALLNRRHREGIGGLIEVSMMESIVDLQFEVFTTYLNDPTRPPIRSSMNNANAYLPAPYGIYATADGFIALAMGSVTNIAKLIGCPLPPEFSNVDDWLHRRDEIKTLLQNHFMTNTSEHWLALLEPHDVWCSKVLTWDKMMEEEGFDLLSMQQTTTRKGGLPVKTTRCPIRIDGRVLTSPKAAPRLGENEVDQLRMQKHDASSSKEYAN